MKSSLAALQVISFLFLLVSSSKAQMTHQSVLMDLLGSHQVMPMETNWFSQEVALESSSSGRKNVGLAAVYSLLLPGMGELYVGNYSMGKYFTIAEGALLLTLFGVDRHAQWLQDDARRFAVQRAGVTLDGKDDQYYSDIGNWSDVYSYNEQVLKDRRPHLVYDPNSSHYWSWDSEANRIRYRDLRVRSDERFNDVRFVALAIGLNHLVSAINAARLAMSHNRSTEQASLIDVRARVIGGLASPSGFVLSVQKSF